MRCEPRHTDHLSSVPHLLYSSIPAAGLLLDEALAQLHSARYLSLQKWLKSIPASALDLMCSYNQIHLGHASLQSRTKIPPPPPPSALPTSLFILRVHSNTLVTGHGLPYFKKTLTFFFFTWVKQNLSDKPGVLRVQLSTKWHPI